MDCVQTDGMTRRNEFPHGGNGLVIDFLVKEKGKMGVELTEFRQQRQPLSVSGIVEGQAENACRRPAEEFSPMIVTPFLIAN